MAKIAVTYSPIVGGSSVVSLKESLKDVCSDVIDADFRTMMADIPEEEFNKLYSTPEGCQKLFAHAKAKGTDFLKNVDCLVLSGSIAMIDPQLFNKERESDQKYDFSRTIAELALVHIATDKGMPILGVCGGHQVIAVHSGGEVASLSATQLEKQYFMNYDVIKLNKDSMLAQIFGGENIKPDATSPYYEGEFFGAHSQVVSKLGKGFKQTATASDEQSIEATESEFGVPIFTTQFHPEISIKGLPYTAGIYKKNQHNIEINLNVFKYLNAAAETYHQKQKILEELNRFKPTDENALIKPSQIKKQIDSEELQKKHEEIIKTISFDKKIVADISIAMGAIIATTFFIIFPPAGMVAFAGIAGTVALGVIVGALVTAIRLGLGLGLGLTILANKLETMGDAIVSFFRNQIRNQISKNYTHVKVNLLRQKEEAVNVKIPVEELSDYLLENVNGSPTSSFLEVIKRLPVKTPDEILRETPATLWTEQDDNLVLKHHVNLHKKPGLTCALIPKLII